MTISIKKLLATLSVVSFFIVAAAVIPSTAAPTTAKHPIEYHIGVSPAVVRDGQSLQYFKSQGFCEVHLVAHDQGTYQAELNTIKSLGMRPVIDIEVPIWGAGQYRGTPITSYAGYFQSLKAAGWEYVASEGGRDGDVAYITQFFKGYINYNCDQCGLWHESTGYLFHTQAGTIRNSWESYYPQEWQYIQRGAKEAEALGKENGILAGAWGNNNGNNQILANSLNGGSPTYKEMLDWSYANGCGFKHFHVWTDGATDGIGAYKGNGFETIVSQLQQDYPAKGTTIQPTPTTTPTATPTKTPPVTPTPTVTPTPVPKAVVKAPTPTPTATPKPQNTVKQPTPTPTATPTAAPKVVAKAPTPTPTATPKPPIKPTATPAAKPQTVVKDPTPTPTVTPTPVPKVVAKAPAAKPQTVVKDPTPTPTVTPTQNTTVDVTPVASVKPVKQQPTATQKPKEQLVFPADSTSHNTSNGTVPANALSLAQPSNVASLPPQPVLEFSVLGVGIPALVVGAIYLLMRKE